MKSLLLFANDDGAFDARLEAALAVARTFESHLTCVQATPFPAFVLGDPFGGVYAFPTVIEEIHKSERAHRARVEERHEHDRHEVVGDDGRMPTFSRMDSSRRERATINSVNTVYAQEIGRAHV